MRSGPTRSWWCERAWIDSEVVDAVLITCDDGGTITDLTAGAPAGNHPALVGIVYPGMANAHSHAFHRALRGRVQSDGDFWTWRQDMYRLADRLDPDSYLALATATYAEMALAGYTVVGEFHYLHHGPGGTTYSDPNQMGEVLREAAHRAGIRLTLLDACYLQGGIGMALEPTQLRFSDRTAGGWAERWSQLKADDNTRVGAAIHSVRAVTPEQMTEVATTALGSPLHFHLSEQPAENRDCLEAYGLTPTALLDRQAVLGPATTAVHAIHLSKEDLGILGTAGTGVCACPTTERDLGDGIGRFHSLSEKGCPIALGTDQHSSIDPFEEARGLEMNERLGAGRRGVFSTKDLIDCLTVNGHRSLGWEHGGSLAVGSTCDLVGVQLDSVRTAGADPAAVVLSATAADVHTVVVGGVPVVVDGEHRLGDVGRMLTHALSALQG